MPKEAPIGQVHSMQLLRAVAVVLVICAHVSVTRLDMGLGTIGVDFFFLLSGFVMIIATQTIHKQKRPALSFLRSRFVRIVPMYWLALLALLALTRLTHTSISGRVFVASIFFLPFNAFPSHAAHIFEPTLSVGWTLTYEVLFYICFAICLWLRVKPLWIALAFVPASAYGFFHHETTSAALSLCNFRLLEFVMGMAFAYAYISGRLLNRLTAALAILAGITAVSFRSHDTIAVHSFVWAPAAALMFFSLLSFEDILGNGLPVPVDLVANASYSIYLVHQQFIVLPLQKLGNVLGAGEGTPLLFEAVWIFLEFAAALFVGISVHVIVERPLVDHFKVRIGGGPVHGAARSE